MDDELSKFNEPAFSPYQIKSIQVQPNTTLYINESASSEQRQLYGNNLQVTHIQMYVSGQIPTSYDENVCIYVKISGVVYENELSKDYTFEIMVP